MEISRLGAGAQERIWMWVGLWAWASGGHGDICGCRWACIDAINIVCSSRHSSKDVVLFNAMLCLSMKLNRLLCIISHLQTFAV